MALAPILLWFRADLRLSDHRSLAAAVETGRPIVPVYLLDDVSPGAWAPGGASRWWLHGSLASLAADLADCGSRLILRRGAARDVIPALAEEIGADLVHCSAVVEPWAEAMERDLNTALASRGVTLRRFRGALVHDPDAIRTKTGDPYKVYSPFWRAVSAAGGPPRPLPAPKRIVAPAAWPSSGSLEDLGLLPRRPDWAGGLREAWQPGEAGALRRLERFLDRALVGYADQRNRPDVEGTSRLSPHLHFGEIGPGQCWHAAIAAAERQGGKADKGLEVFLKEIAWREFSYHLLHHFPTLPEAPFRPEFAKFPWAQDDAALAAWQRGRTGYPIVDAGMRELWTTGWMHNRVRMIVASFLVKDLMIPWQAGETWFWDTLVDADLASNAASWQWVAGSGADAAPYFRIFNPVKQGQTFDPDGAYVRRWVPELSRLPDKVLQAPWEAPLLLLREAGVALGHTYPHPIVDHARQRDLALAAFQSLKG